MLPQFPQADTGTETNGDTKNSRKDRVAEVIEKYHVPAQINDRKKKEAQ